MELIDIPTEQTTAVTDVILAFVAAFVTFFLYRIGKRLDIVKVRIWCGAFSLLTLAALLGAVAHGFKMSDNINYLIWQPLNLFLGIAISLFVAGVIYDWKNYSIQKSILILLLAAGFIFFIVTLIIPGSFIIFILYEAIAMLFSFFMYLSLWKQRKLPGAGFMTFGILITIIAAIVQAIDGIQIHILWRFDNNGLFHIIQTIALGFLYIGLKTEMLSRKHS